MLTIIDKLKQIAVFTPEYERKNNTSKGDDRIIHLLTVYPYISPYKHYLNFLECFGGAHIKSSDFSLGIYGFEGVVVSALEEGDALDLDRYFIFGEVLYYKPINDSFIFAFDIKTEKDAIFICSKNDFKYHLCRPSFNDFLLSFTDKDYPMIDDR